jgi:hypothetical protein
MRTSLTLTAAILLACGTAVAQNTPAPLQSRLSAKVEGGKVSLSDGKLPLVLTFTSKTDKEQTFENTSYVIVLLDENGEQVDDALLVPTVLRKITIKGTTTDKPGLTLARSKLKAGKRYYLVVAVRNLTAMATFETTK